MAGNSGCGKTTLTLKMISNWEECMDFPPTEVHVFFSHMQEAYEKLLSSSPFPVVLHSEPLDESFEVKNGLVILDDLQGSDSVGVIKDFFIKKSHHFNTSVIYLVQNLFDKDPAHRFISLNSTYIVIFKNPRDASQVTHLNKQIYPHAKNFLTSAYKTITEGGPRSYMVIDNYPETPEPFRIRNTLFPQSDFGNAFAFTAV